MSISVMMDITLHAGQVITEGTFTNDPTFLTATSCITQQDEHKNAVVMAEKQHNKTGRLILLSPFHMVGMQALDQSYRVRSNNLSNCMRVKFKVLGSIWSDKYVIIFKFVSKSTPSENW